MPTATSGECDLPMKRFAAITTAYNMRRDDNDADVLRHHADINWHSRLDAPQDSLPTDIILLVGGVPHRYTLQDGRETDTEQQPTQDAMSTDSGVEELAPTVFFIDSENQQGVWRSVLTLIKPRDEIRYVLTTKVSPPSAEDRKAAASIEVVIKLITSKAGAQELDKSLKEDLARTVGRHGLDRRYVIVSEDKGFNNVVKFYAGRGFDIARISCK